jgi:hypothetical protein
VILDRYQEVTEEKLKRLQELKIRSIDMVKSDKILGQEIITNTLIKDSTRSQKRAGNHLSASAFGRSAGFGNRPPADRKTVL